MNSITEEVRYRILAGVHMWDLEHGGRKRNWQQIRELAEVRTPVHVMKKVFKKFYKPSEVFFPYPIIMERTLSDPVKRCELFGIEAPLLNYCSINGDVDMREWVKKVKIMTVAGNLLEPWAMHTKEVKRFLGFSDDSFGLEQYTAALEEVKLNHLTVEKREKFALYRPGEENEKADFFVQREMRKLIQAFRAKREPSTIPLRLSDGVQTLTDVSYYRRRLYTSGSILYARMVLSDYELLQLFKAIVQHGFDSESTDTEYWDDLLSLLQISYIHPLDARSDFYRVFLPRFELIKTHLDPDLKGEGFEFEDNIISAYRVIYHSCKENTYLEVLRTVTVMQKYGWLNIDLLGGLGHHYCSFKFVIKVLKVGAVAFDSTNVEYSKKKYKFMTDLYDNYRKFKYYPE